MHITKSRPGIFLLSLLLLFTQAASVAPAPTIILVNQLPLQMAVGETYTVMIEVNSPEPFLSVMAMPDLAFPGRGVVGHGVSREGRGYSAILEVPFTAKSSTIDFPGGVDRVSVAVGVRYPTGQLVAERYEFTVRIP